MSLDFESGFVSGKLKPPGNGEEPTEKESGPVNLSIYVKASTLDKMTFDKTWLVENLIEAGRVYEFFGTWKSGKTLAVLDMVANMCLERLWAGRRTAKALVVYVAGEAVEDVEMRLAAWRLQRAIHDDMPLYIRTRPVNMADEVYASLLAAEIEALKEKHAGLPVVVVLDTLNRNLGGGNENAEGMQLFTNHLLDIVVRPCKATGLVVHHSGHGDKDRGRGHSSFEAAVDGLIKVSKNKTPGGPSVVTVQAMEMRSTAGDDSLAFRIEVQELPGSDNFGKPIEAPVLRYLDGYAPVADKTKGVGGNQKKALEILQTMQDEERRQRSRIGDDPEEAMVLVESWRNECMKKDVVRHRQRFYEVKKGLTERGLIEVVGEIHVRVPDETAVTWA